VKLVLKKEVNGVSSVFGILYRKENARNLFY
jgi:hypothetical protein